MKQKIEQAVRVKAPVDKVSSLIEDLSRVPEWHPHLTDHPGVTEISLEKGEGQGLGSTVEWKARLAGITITGSSVATAFIHGKEYAWDNTERITGLSSEGRFLLKPVDDQTELTAIFSYSLPALVAPLVNHDAVNRIFGTAVKEALNNISKAVTASE